jgi:hypothetical protein
MLINFTITAQTEILGNLCLIRKHVLQKYYYKKKGLCHDIDKGVLNTTNQKFFHLQMEVLQTETSRLMSKVFQWKLLVQKLESPLIGIITLLVL